MINLSKSLRCRLLNNLETIPLLRKYSTGVKKKVFVEVYGCQMNTNDAEIVHGILAETRGDGFEKCDSVGEADVILLMTCAIRENAENKIWNRLDYLRSLEKQFKKQITIGVLGCMAERLKEELLEKRANVDLVCGPDAYRDLPKLIQSSSSNRWDNMSVALSAEETYADVKPVRIDSNRKSAYVSVMRGCNNMCAFCIVPFTRGRERSRPLHSVVEEVKLLSEQGIKEITLLGQNVNSYCDEISATNNSLKAPAAKLSEGFTSVFKRPRVGADFADLLRTVAKINPEIRFRFTSPHPKDFPEKLLEVIQSHKNVCKQIHLPAQSGSSKVLDKMRRGYTRESYLSLVEKIRKLIPHVCLSSDFISGFVDETEVDHQQTLDLLATVGYDMAYMYAYSMREKTMAHRRYEDNIPEEVKQRRLREIIDAFYSGLAKKTQLYLSSRQLVLIDGPSKKDPECLSGRTDGNKTVVIPGEGFEIGDYVETEIVGIQGTTLIGKFLSKSSISAFQP